MRVKGGGPRPASRPAPLLPHPSHGDTKSVPSPAFPRHQPLDMPSPSLDLCTGSESVPHPSSTGLEATVSQQSPPHSSSSGLNAANGSQQASPSQSAPHELSQLLASPTEIDGDLQAQAWVLLPDLAMDLNKLSGQRPRSVAVDHQPLARLQHLRVGTLARTRSWDLVVLSWLHQTMGQRTRLVLCAIVSRTRLCSRAHV